MKAKPNKVTAIWLASFARLERDGPEAFTLRQCSGMYAVASIMYYAHDQNPVSDPCFDRLCSYLLEHLTEARAQGADMLEEGMLRAGSGYDTKCFVRPYHNVAGWLVDTVA